MADVTTTITTTLLVLLATSAIVDIANGQLPSINDNIYDSLDGWGCSQFKALIDAGQLQSVFRSSQPLTLFAFNDTALENIETRTLNVEITSMIQNDNINEAEEYVNSFTIDESVQESSFSTSKPYTTSSNERRTLFLNQRQLRYGNVASGQPGPKRYYCNGAVVISSNNQAGQHTLHILDRVLNLQWPKSALAYAHSYNPTNVKYKFYTQLMETLKIATELDSNDNYRMQVNRILGQGDQVTFFLPTDDAVDRIPTQVLTKLRGDTARLLDIITLHIIPDQIMYTTLVNHNEVFQSQRDSGRITFRKNYEQGAVFVTGALRNGHPVTAKMTTRDVTVLNGVVHHIDAVLGMVFRTAYEEIDYERELGNFRAMVDVSRVDLQNILKNQQVIVFAPNTAAVTAISNVYQNYIHNQSLVDMVLRYSMLQQDEQFSLTEYQGGYESLVAARSRYNSHMIKIYSQGNDTWVEGGYVRARVVKPDIGVTNGLVHIIDAVFGVPTRDIPHTIFCEDRLQMMYNQLESVGLIDYLHDPMLVKNQGCTHRVYDELVHTGDMVRQPDFRNVCGGGGYRCQFTFFVPNDTALASFVSSQGAAEDVMLDVNRWRWVLRRLITFREVIYIDKIADGAVHSYIADNGEIIYIQPESRVGISSGRRTAHIMYRGVRAEIIHSDIGATNGVIHIINNIIFVPEDIYRRSGAVGFYGQGVTSVVMVLAAVLGLLMWT